MKHDLVGVLWIIVGVTLAPVVADSVGENAARAVEVGCGYGAAHLRVALETMLRVLVPEVESSVATGSTECSMLRVEGDCVHGVNVGNVALIGYVLTVALEGKVGAEGELARTV